MEPASHMIIENVIFMKRYVRHLLFDNHNRLTIEYIGGTKSCHKLKTNPTAEEIAAYEAELEDR
jgi:hypothetical protein